MFHGRADGVLNPSGVRFGSAEIYRVIEGKFSQEIVDSICVGQRRPTDPDERVMLFLLMKPSAAFTADLVARVKSAIRIELSPRHVPKFIFETPEIPVGDPYSARSRRLTRESDNGQPQESGAACEADCVWQANPPVGYPAQPGELGILLPIRRGGKARA